MNKFPQEQRRPLTSNEAMFHVICRKEGGLISGQIYNACFAKDIPFQGLGEMLLAIDDMCEATQCPMADTKPRFLEDHTIRTLPEPLEQMTDDWRKCSPYEWLRNKNIGNRENPDKKQNVVFLLHIIYRRQSSMQGMIICTDDAADEVYFRSGLELIRIIDAYMA